MVITWESEVGTSTGKSVHCYSIGESSGIGAVTVHILCGLGRELLWEKMSLYSHSWLLFLSCRYGIMQTCWQWNATDRPSPAELLQYLQKATKTSNDHAVLQVPELVVPELYANVAGIDVDSLTTDYTVL